MTHPADQIVLTPWVVQRPHRRTEGALALGRPGPIDSILSQLFPTHQHYTSTRPILAPIDSGNNPVEPRKPGSAGGFQFHLLKAPGALEDDTLLAVVTIKRGDIDVHQAEIQMKRYLQWVALTRKRIPDLRGYLILGDTTLLFRLNDEQVAVLDHGMPTVAANKEPDDLISSLRQLARDTWDSGGTSLSHPGGPSPLMWWSFFSLPSF
ncbi:hypothetical protein BS47DRAFT_1336618 [Hydnum rufescens UP504]|uniref:Uncharacterized protein n=1 Tax=Hydnum rufescens UP504 TaxID=1448309 RepID=A0A9P6B958_9AGAM|nr:hypothetical protein BS47DRAFT_1336618 [Hydnum rufescens UP504]